MQTADHILLTGAGFTHNFGAPLATGIWGLLLGHSALGSMSKTRELLLRDFDYESAYHTVLSSAEYSTDEKTVMRQATAEVYDFVDQGLQGWSPTLGAPHWES